MATVLIVDDCAAMLTLTTCMLTALGVDCLHAQNGQQALEICRANAPDAVLLDWNMPVMDGPSFQERLKDLPKGHVPKVIFCTIEDEFDKIAKVMGAGADGFIIKPFNLNTLSYNLEKAGVLAGAA